MTQAATGEFSRFRSLFWPIHRFELGRFLPMLLIYSLIVFNYSVLRAAKDALVITAPSSGAEAIPFIKVWAILPMAILFTFIFTRLSNKYHRDRVFYIMMWTFLSFFALFAFILYPLRDYLHPNGLADHLQSILPQGFSGLIAIFRNWTFTMFYVMSELWGTTIMTVLFWGFANEVTSVKDAKRYYAILGLGANIGTIIAGQVAIFLSSEFLFQRLSLVQDRWGQSLILLTTLVVVTGAAALLLYRYLTTRTLPEEEREAAQISEKEKQEEKAKLKMGIRKNFAYLAKSPYLVCIALLVLAYNVSLNMIEVVWKDQLRILYPNPADYNAYMGQVLTFIGITSTIVSAFICGNVIRKYGWTVSALCTPIILLITGAFFFVFLLFKDFPMIGVVSTLLGTTPLALCVFFGSMQNCFSRAGKFTFFDATKEIAFIPLSKECKLKGKAAIDGVGSRLGKSGGSLVHQFLLMIFGSVSLSTPYVGVILLIVFVGWIIAVRSLGRRFEEVTSQAKQVDIPSDTPKVPAKGSEVRGYREVEV